MTLNRNLIKSALYYLDPASHTSTDMAHGVIVGVVTTIMATGKDFVQAVAIVKPLLPDNCNMDAVPECWHAALRKEKS